MTSERREPLLVDSDSDSDSDLVTGATGIIGLNLLHALATQPNPVVGVADGPLPEEALASVEELGQAPTIEAVDVRDGAAAEEVFGRHRPALVIHAAAVTAAPNGSGRRPVPSSTSTSAEPNRSSMPAPQWG